MATRDLPEAMPGLVPKPCSECPWVRTSMRGWLGPATAEQWCEIAHSDLPIACHQTIRETDDDGHGDWSQMKQCMGAAIFRENVGKLPRDHRILVADAPDTELVFAWDNEFIEHHEPNWENHGSS